MESDGGSELEEAIAAYLRSLEAGAPLDRAVLLRNHQGIAPELERFFANHDRVERTARPLREAARTESLPRAFGRYELLEEIGRGGMGIVYKARDLRLKKTVALKTILAGKLASSSDVERFHLEAEAAAGLDHPNIVPIFELGQEDGQHYFTMRLIEGGSLERRLGSFHDDPRAAARLVLVLAKAVRHALQMGILHRDLKPGNILLDAQGEPHITDFGLAKRIDANEDVTSPGEILGTLAYMAPEQAAGGAKRLGTAVDVYGLGAILYALLTGRAPFVGKNAADTLLQVRAQEPVDPGVLNPKVPVELAAIALKCLEKDPARRYESPRTLADDLSNWLEGRSVQARPVSRVRRLWRWCRRNAALSIFVGMASMLVLVAAGALLQRAAQRKGRRDEILETNLYIARNVASVVLNRLQKWGAEVERAAARADLARHLEAWNRSVPEDARELPPGLLNGPEGAWIKEFCEELHRQKDPALENWHILDARGFMVARTPESSIRGWNFRERDYFKGTLAHSGTGSRIHVSSVYRSLADNHYKFDVCAKVMLENRLVGVIASSVTTDPSWGLPDIHDERRKTVLIAPWDPERGPNDPLRQGPPPDYLLLLHPAYRPGEDALAFDRSSLPVQFIQRCGEELLPPPRSATGAKKRAYVDPYGVRDPNFAGSWLAGLAPVGNTGFVLIIQQREE
jgi:serine/threonine-protein kinase